MQSRFGRSWLAGSLCWNRNNQSSFKLTRYISVPQAAMLTVQEIVNHQLTGAAFKDLYAIQNLTLTYVRIEQSVQSHLYPCTKVEKSMLSTEPERQLGRRTEHRQRIFEKNKILGPQTEWFYFQGTHLLYTTPLPSSLPGWPGKRTHRWCKASPAAGWSPL